MESTAFPESQDAMLYYKQIGKRLSSGNEFYVILSTNCFLQSYGKICFLDED